jgi:hypothetical protein
MAATVISVLIARALDECGNRDDLSAGDQLAYYNHGNRLICRLSNPREMRTYDKTAMNTVDGAYAVTLPATTLEGRPVYYCRRVYTSIEHYPVADAAYDMHIDYYAWPTLHAATTENANFDNTMDDALVEAMKYYVWQRIGEHDRAKESFGFLRNLLGTIVASENELIDAGYEVETYSVSGGVGMVEDHLDPFYPR